MLMTARSPRRGVARPPVQRTLSVPTKTFTWRRIFPCSSTTRSRRPGCARKSSASAASTSRASVSTSTRSISDEKRRSGPGIRNASVTSSLLLLGRLLLLALRLPPDGRLHRAAERAAEDRDLHADDRRQPVGDEIPRASFVARAPELPAAGAEVHAARIERVGAEAVAQHGLERVLLREALRAR